MILALDTSTSWLSLAVGTVEKGGLRWLDSRTQHGTGKHTASLPGDIEQLLSEVRVSPGQITGCAVGLGPGSFTGLRMGIATILGLAYGRELPAAGVSSLRAIAYQTLSRSQEASPGLNGAAVSAGRVISLLDARHGQIYAGIFSGASAEPQGAEFSLPPAALAAALDDRDPKLRASALLVGEGVQAYRGILERDFEAAQLAEGPLSPDARAIGELCMPLPPFSLEALFALQPRYVLPSEAEIKFPNGNFRTRPPE